MKLQSRHPSWVTPWLFPAGLRMELGGLLRQCAVSAVSSKGQASASGHPGSRAVTAWIYWLCTGLFCAPNLCAFPCIEMLVHHRKNPWIWGVNPHVGMWSQGLHYLKCLWVAVFLKRVFQYSSHNTQNNLSFQSFQVIVIFLARLFSVLTDADCESLTSAANPQRQSGWEKPLMTPQLYDNQHLVCGVTGFWNLITTLVFQIRVFFPEN